MIIITRRKKKNKNKNKKNTIKHVQISKDLPAEGA